MFLKAIKLSVKPHVGTFFLILAVAAAFGQEFGTISEPVGIQIQDPFLESSKEVKKPPKTPPAPTVSDEAAMFGPVDEASYIVGPGDILYVAVGTKSFEAPVGPDGNVLIESFPPILVGNKSLAETRKILAEKLARYYKAGGIYVSLSATKKFLVSITGSVKVPGMYVAKAGSRLSNGIFYAEGFSRQASLQVTIRRASGKTEKFNLGAYYRDGDLSQNPYLAQGDQVFVGGIDYSAPFVRVQNEEGVRLVQLMPDDNLEGIVSQAANFESFRDWDHVNVYQDGILVEKILRSNGRAYKPKSGSTLEVRSTQRYVFVGGTVITPGGYPYNPSFTALDYVAKSGITVNSAATSRITIIDADGKVRKVNARTETPKPGDHILVSRSTEAKMRDYVGITVSVASLAASIVTIWYLTNQ